MSIPLSLILNDSALDPEASKQEKNVIRIRSSSSGKRLYKVYLYLEGDDLPFVRKVTYQLHPTFRPSRRRVMRSFPNPKCKLTIWTWGIFKVEATIEDIESRRYTVTHMLRYDEDFDRTKVRFREDEA